MSQPFLAAGLAILCGVVSGCSSGAMQVQNQTGGPIWITMYLSDGMVEEAGLIGDGEAIPMRSPLKAVDRIEYKSGGVLCRMDREDVQAAPESRSNDRRTVVLKPCEPMADPE